MKIPQLCVSLAAVATMYCASTKPVAEWPGENSELEAARTRPTLPIVSLGVPPAFTDPAASGKWNPIGPTQIASTSSLGLATNGRADAIAVSPADERVMLMGANGGGIWRSEDGGAGFSLVTETDGGVPAIAFSSADPSIVYAMTDGNLGVPIFWSDYDGAFLRSADGGRSWSKRSLPYANSYFPDSANPRIRPDPRDRNRVLITTSHGVWSSPDGGLTWSKALPCDSCDLVSFSTDPSIWLAHNGALSGTGQAGIYRSTDGGRTWSLSFTGPFAPRTMLFGTLASSPSSGTAYWCANGRLFRTRDQGLTWIEQEKLLNLGAPADCPLNIAVTSANPDMLYYGYDQGTLWVSTDAGARFYLYQFNGGYPLHVDNRAFAMTRTASYFATDGGLYKEDFDARTVSSLIHGVGSTVQFYSIAASPLDPDLLVGGTQDNGFMFGGTSPGAWHLVGGGDIGVAVFDANNPTSILWTYNLSQHVIRTTGLTHNNLNSQEVANPAMLEPGSTRAHLQWFGTSMPLARAQRGTVYTGTWRLYSSNDFGTTWNRTSDLDLTRGPTAGAGGDMLTMVGIAVDDDNVIYTVSGSNRVMRSGDGGANWTDVTPKSLSDFSPDFRAFVVLGNGTTALMGLWNGRGLLRTTNSGTTWTPVPNFPAISVQALYSDRFEPGVVYAGTDSGVFRSTNAGTTWSFYGSGLPRCPVSSITRTADHRLIAATFGRGAYVFTPPAPPRRRSVQH